MSCEQMKLNLKHLLVSISYKQIFTEYESTQLMYVQLASLRVVVSFDLIKHTKKLKIVEHTKAYLRVCTMSCTH